MYPFPYGLQLNMNLQYSDHWSDANMNLTHKLNGAGGQIMKGSRRTAFK